MPSPESVVHNMRVERKRNAARSILSGFTVKIYNILMPFIMRTAIIYYLGIEYLGLSSLFTSILQVLNLAELGVGSALVFSMYKPIAEDDENTVCALMLLYRKYYRVIGIVVLGGGLIILPFVPKLIHGNVPDDINVFFLYLLNLLATVVSYWLFAYRNSILNAHQRNDVISKILLLTNTVQYAIQLLSLAVFHNYYLFIATIIFSQILNNILTSFVSKKFYPQYMPIGTLPAEEIKLINGRVRDVFTSKLGGTIVTAADTIIISAFLGLRLLAIYQNYYFIMHAISGLFAILFTSITAGIGNSLVLDSEEKNYQDYRTLTLITFCLIAICSACMITLYQPFITLWVGADFKLGMSMVVLFCLYFIVFEYLMLAGVYKEAAGIWHQDRFRPLTSGAVNLALNLLMVNTYGLYGVLLSTIVSIGFISAPWITANLFRYIFPGRSKDYVALLLKCLSVVVISTVVSYFLTGMIQLTGGLELLVKLIFSVLISSFFCILILGQTQEFKRARNIVLSIIGR